MKRTEFNNLANYSSEYVKKDDYLKIVEENEQLKKNEEIVVSELVRYERTIERKDEEIKEKDNGIFLYKSHVKTQDNIIENLEKENEHLRKNSNDLFKLTKFISEERACYGRAGELSVDIAIDTIKSLEIKLKEKDLKIEELHYLYLSTFKGYNNQKQMIKELKEHNEVLTAMLESLQPCMNCCEEEKEETYTLIYGYKSNGVIKEYKQSGLLKEDYEEMYGMDSDNWEYHTLVKN
jgi:Uncharacterized conserved protein